MSEAQKKQIFSFVKQNHEDLKETTQQEDFADLLYEIYKSVKPADTFKQKIKFIKSELQDEDSIAASDFIESNVDLYIEKLVNHVENKQRRSSRGRSRSNSKKSRRSDKEDPLERNNLKADSSGSSDNDDRGDKKQHRLQLKQKPNKHDSRDQRHNNDDNRRDDGRDSRRQGGNKYNNNKKINAPFNLPNLLMMGMQGLNKFNPSLNLNEVMNSIRPNNQGDYRHRKDTVFLTNLPRELRTLQEIDEIFRNKGAINNVNLAGKVPSVQFKKTQDAQNLINNDKFIVHKGIKVEMNSNPNQFKSYDRQRRNQENDDQPRKYRRNEDGNGHEKQNPEVVSQIPNQETQEPQDDSIKKKAEQVKLERDLQKQIETFKSSINTLLAEKLRTVLYLTKRDYSVELKLEIEELKKHLKTMREAINTMDNFDKLKSEQTILQETLDHTILVTNIPEEHFTNKTIMATLTDHFAQYGKIDTLQVRLREHSASIKFFNYESAEKAYLAPQQYQLQFVHSNILRYIKSVEQS